MTCTLTEAKQNTVDVAYINKSFFAFFFSKGKILYVLETKTI